MKSQVLFSRRALRLILFVAEFLILVIAVAASGQNIINTVAGGGVINSNPALADIPGPTAVVEDSAGNKFVVAPYSDYLFELTNSNTVQTIAGLGWGHYNKSGGGTSGPASEIPLYGPTGLAIDKHANVYIADSVNNVVRKVYLQAGTYYIATVAGQRPQCNQQNYPTCGDGGRATAAYLAGPEGVAVDSSGNLYIADTGDNVIRVVSKGVINLFAGSYNGGIPCQDPIYPQSCGDGGLATQALLNGPTGVAVDSQNNVYIADTYDRRIRCVLAVLGGCGDSAKQYAVGDIITVGGTGAPCTIYNDGPNDNPAYCGDGGAATAALIGNPAAVSVSSSGTIYVTDTRASTIRTISNGIINLFAGTRESPGFQGDGGSPLNAELMNPSGVYVDKAGNVLIADTGNQRIREVTGSGQNAVINTILGGGNGGDNSAATAAMLANPYAVAVDAQGNYYTADAANNRIRVVNTQTSPITVATVTIQPGEIATVAGNGNAGYTPDGGPATMATLNSPEGVVVDSSGNIFFSDTYNGWVREVNGQTGILTTVLASKPVNQPEALAIDAAGNLFIADPPAEVIWEISGGAIAVVAGNGTSGYSGDGGPATQAELAQPTGVAVDAYDNFYIADSVNNVVRCVLGVLGGCGDTAQKYEVGYIVTYAYNGGVVFKGDGGPATQASRWGATEVAVDLGGNLFISGGTHDRVIQRVDAASLTIMTVAGDARFQPGFGFSGDGGPASMALINSSGLALDSQENLFIADAGNNRVREIGQLIAVVNLKPHSLKFGSVPVGQQSPPKTVTLTNIGSNDLSISQISIVGADSGDFSQINSCPSGQIPPMTNSQSTCTVTVTFTPTAKGRRTATLNFTDNGYQSPQGVPLSGIGE